MKTISEIMDAALEFGTAYYVECVVWGIIIASSAAICTVVYACHPNS